mmetsp:Transcript_9601/g.13574  ORF Transcript_9601/g.13574 Transcript_9601/m.13574 type:complete len:386 (-) Transcript_9601:43-1200(-)
MDQNELETSMKLFEENGENTIASSDRSKFQSTIANETKSLMDGVVLSNNLGQSASDDQVIMPWLGFGTYRLGQKQAYKATLEALQVGYRCIDTAFIYGGETTEIEVGKAIQKAVETKVLSHRDDVFIITKHWRKYHGYEPTKECLEKSLARLQTDCVDLWLMHWPGPAYNTMSRRKDILEQEGPWYYSNVSEKDMKSLRGETWRAMEDALKERKVRSIGVSNFSIAHLETLKTTATLWPPAVNQVECHPLYPQDELRAYCKKEGIVLQAYASLGGQDGTKKKWVELLGGTMKTPKKLLFADAVEMVAQEVGRTNAQILLRWCLQRECASTPKTTNRARMEENANIFDFELSEAQMSILNELVQRAKGDTGRLCWRTDPLRMLDFE